jgi:hypothetical protein
MCDAGQGKRLGPVVKAGKMVKDGKQQHRCAKVNKQICWSVFGDRIMRNDFPFWCIAELIKHAVII